MYNSILKIAIYCIYWLISSLFRVRHNNHALVLMYHAVENSPHRPGVKTEEFIRQMDYLSNHKKVVRLADVVKAQKDNQKLSHDYIAVTFDDGYRDLLTTVLPIIEKYQIPITVFVPSDLNATTDPTNYPRLNKEELQKLASSPLVQIESHGRTHRRMTKLTPAELQTEMTVPRSEIQSYTGVLPQYISYPFGSRNKEVEEQAVKAGYVAAFGINDGVVGSSSSLMTLHRVQIDCTMSFTLFKLRLTKAVEVARVVRRWRSKIV